MKMRMKTVDTQGMTYIEPVPDGTSEWYYGISYEHGDLYEAEEVFRAGGKVKGNAVCLIHYPDGEVFWPVPKKTGTCSEKPVFLNAARSQACRAAATGKRYALATNIPCRAAMAKTCGFNATTC